MVKHLPVSVVDGSAATSTTVGYTPQRLPAAAGWRRLFSTNQR